MDDVTRRSLASRQGSAVANLAAPFSRPARPGLLEAVPMMKPQNLSPSQSERDLKLQRQSIGCRHKKKEKQKRGEGSEGS
jgi:hypothetical protein